MELFKIQEDLRLQLNKLKVNFKKCSKERLTKQYVETRLQQLNDKWSDFVKTHNQILKCKEDYSKLSYFENDIFCETEEFYLDFKSELKYIFDKFSNSTSLDSSSKDSDCRSNGTNVKLPKITIPTFSGKYTEWPSFRDLFVSLIHNNGSLDKVQKMHYLKSHLSGEAEQLLRHVPITSDNYDECWANLKERYNNKKYLSNCLLKRFFSQTNILTESSTAIKELLDTSVDTLNGIKHLGIDISSWDIIIIYVMCSKLDNESRKLWEARISSSSDLPNFIEFKEFLESRFRSLEFLDTKTRGNKSSSGFKPKVHHVINAVESTSHTKIITCSYCQGDHKISNCKKFSKLDVDTRRNFVQTSKLCYNCLGTNHSIKYCRINATCRICKKKHHSLLHATSAPTPATSEIESNPMAGVSTAVSTNETETAGNSNYSPINTYFSKENIHNEVLLATAVIKVEAKNEYFQYLRALLDQGSQASFITESAVQLLGLKKIPSTSLVTGIGGKSGSVTSKFIVNFKMHSLYNPNFTTQVTAYVLSKLTSFLPSKDLQNSSWPELETIQLADPDFGKPNKIDVLLGAEIYGQIVEEGLIKGPPGAPIAQKTSLGWILSGQIQPRSGEIHCHHISIDADTHINDNDLLRRFWELESEASYAGTEQNMSVEEIRCQELYEQTTSRHTSGRYIVKLPFKDEDPKCKYGNSELIATKRFYMLEKRLSKDPELKSMYVKVIHEYLDLNHMQGVPIEERVDGRGVYLPHHAVIRNDKSTSKVRVVFDASCRGSNGVSLNNDLMVGPTLQSDLRTIITRWRRHRICLTSDIVKMYRQIMIESTDTEFQRIVWRDSPEDDLQHFRLLRVTFGTASAPYLAVRTLNQVAYDEGENYPMAASRVTKDFYMDDLMTGHETISDTFRLYQEMNGLLKLGGFELQKWSSNDKELLAKINKETNVESKNLEIKSDPVLKILGLIWNREKDKFEYKVQLPNLSKPITKRKVISDIARLFDPLGWIAPTIVIAKILIQKIWISGVGWDEPLPSDLLNEWLVYRSNLSRLTGFSLPRWLHIQSGNKRIELHGFSDASNNAYAAVVYIRVLDHNDIAYINLITAKTKVAPVKQLTIPRLELCGAVLTAKLLMDTAETLNIPKENIHAWTDSSVVLAWISSHPCRWQTFVANRVSNILSLMDSSQWSHVKSKENPADLASRGVKASELNNSKLWREGPDWLKKKEINYSRPKGIETNIEEKRNKMCHVGNIEEDEIWTRFSSLKRLERVLSWVRRWLNVLRPVNKKVSTPWLTSSELKDTLRIYIKHCQNQYFHKEIEGILKTQSVYKNSKLASLNPFLDTENILRVGGRLQQANISDDRKHPVLIPKESHLARLLIADAHERTLHGGIQLMLNYLRSKYWILDSRRLASSFIRKCIVCVRYSNSNRDQIMGQLPSARVNPCRPFRQSGVDYAGPINIRSSKGRGYHASKGYICLFVCMTTRAVHLEAVSDLTSQGFLAAFKRFVARRGLCTDLWSDNGTNFVGASRELRSMFSSERSDRKKEIGDWLGTNGTNWHFIPPHAPNFGGLWEAGIKSTKHHLKRVIGDTKLTFEEITTVLAQIEACLNSRPISQLSNDPDDPSPLTPGHFLVGEQLVLISDTSYENSTISSLKRWQLTQRMVQSFWRKWSREYLVQFLNRYKWKDQNQEPKIGDVVLVKEDDLPPSKWLYGIITDKHPGIDNVTRVVTLKCKGVNMKRPVSKLCILPVTN